MRKYLFALLMVFLYGSVQAAPPSRISTYRPLTTISSADVTANEDAIFSYLQSGVDTYKDGTIINADIAASANIDDAKLDLGSIAQNVIFNGTAGFNGAANFDGALRADSTIYFTQLPTTTEDAPTLNGQLTNKVYVDGKFNTSTGHDHDGVDSKQIDYADILNVPAIDFALYSTAGTYTWTAPAEVSTVFVTMVGGGGGGGGGTGSGTSAGGGGAGAYVLRAALKVTPGNSYTVTVGAKGDKGTAGAGSAGGNSSVVGDDFTLTCNGGSGGGIPTAGSGGASSGSFTGGSATVGIGSGMAGGVLATSAGANGGAGAASSAGGGGGAGSRFGRGGDGGDAGGAYAGTSAQGFGSGGGGGWGAGGGYVGGDGAAGLVYLEW